MNLTDRWVFGIGTIVSAALLWASLSGHTSEFGWVEALGFITGAACVWLAVRENVLNWPIGIANNVFYVVVFFNSRLFADMSLQIAFGILGIAGWIFWARRTESRETLHVGRTPALEWLILAILCAIATAGWTMFLRTVDDASPFLDALTTATSLAAQYMLTRKYLENWWVWIATDVVSIYLYAQKGLGLTAVLYAIFLTMCVVGLRRWLPSVRRPALGDGGPARA